ncbi:MAG: nucleotide exchange factor GrpE [Peptococcaceae bacterium]|jgi:molecular chaperone GrpE (heat shock protein)|nr:nucleotide exchange factor GrpE [Peptococcaceae bacterium]MDH7525841.1 nucleotide exchange factor GrpE [Peptococcaceae bacterium]
MIDFRKELAKFDFFAIDAEFTGYYYETAQVIEAFNSTLKRIGKELNNANMQLEEVLSQHLEEKEKDKHIAEQQRAIAACEDEKRSLVQGLVEVLDQLEDIYRYSLQHERGTWSEQMQLLWKNTSAKLLLHGIIRIEGENTPFDPRFHSAVEVKENNNLPSGTILEVLRCGYMYQSHLLRKAQVIVNKLTEAYEQ